MSRRSIILHFKMATRSLIVIFIRCAVVLVLRFIFRCRSRKKIIYMHVVLRESLTFNKQAMHVRVNSVMVYLFRQNINGKKQELKCSGGIDSNEILRKISGWIDDMVQVAKGNYWIYSNIILPFMSR